MLNAAAEGLTMRKATFNIQTYKTFIDIQWIFKYLVIPNLNFGSCVDFK